METRIKERLVGAIALVAIVVIIVPEFLTGPRAPSATAPRRGAVPVRTVTIDLAATERGAISRPPAPAVAAVPGTEPTSSPAAAVPPGAASVPAVAIPPPAPAAAPPLSQTAPVAAAARPASSSHAATGWVVQLASFVSHDNAERFAAGLRGRGYAAVVTEYRGSGRLLYRVRVGPEPDRARAEAIAGKLAREGHRGSVAPQT